jgi:acyl-coenzyme A synthetase/AMP-(fatty) acid ligase
VPKDIWLVDEIPVNERGKTSRRELARRYLETRSASSG